MMQGDMLSEDEPGEPVSREQVVARRLNMLLKSFPPDQVLDAAQLMHKSLDEFIAAASTNKTVVFSPETIENMLPAILSPETIENAMPEKPVEQPTQAHPSLNRYIIEGPLGSGGMGVVYYAIDTPNGRRVALKVLSPDKANDKEAVQRFERESRLTGKLTHPNIVKQFGVGRLPDGRPFYTMQLIGDKGEVSTLEALIKERKQPTERGKQLREKWTLRQMVQLIMQPITRAMQSAHDKAIIHRDLKPGNILIGPYGDVYVTDFGLGKDLNDPADKEHYRYNPSAKKTSAEDNTTIPEDDTEITQDQRMGTPGYAAPEQILAPPKVNRSADIYGLGGILYYILTGENPHYVKPQMGEESINTRKEEVMRDLSNFGDPNVLRYANKEELAQEASVLVDELDELDGCLGKVACYALMRETRHGILINPRELVAKMQNAEPIPEELEKICTKALQKDPKERYNRCEEMWTEFQDYLDGRSALILEREAKELIETMSRDTNPRLLEDLEHAIATVAEEIRRKEGLGRKDTIDDRIKVAELYLAKAKLHTHLTETDAILACYEEAEKYVKQPLDATLKFINAIIIYRKASVHFYRKDLARAIEAFKQALTLWEDQNNLTMKAETLYNIALVNAHLYGRQKAMVKKRGWLRRLFWWTRDDPERKREEYFRLAEQHYVAARELADKVKNDIVSISARLGLGNFYNDENPEDMRIPELYREAEQRSKNKTTSAQINLMIARNLRKREKYRDARPYADKSFELATDTGAKLWLREAAFEIQYTIVMLDGPADERIKYGKLARQLDKQSNMPRGPPTLPQDQEALYRKKGLDIRELDG